ncbi:MAG: type II secretion system protein [Planctomycetota bacterium]
MDLSSFAQPAVRRRFAPQRGLTLIELVVVLTVLTALGSLLVPVIDNMISRTHFAKCSITIPDVSRNIMRSFAADLTYPDRWDSLIDAADGSSLFPRNPGGADVGGELTTATLTQQQVDGLAALGITEVVDLDATADDATWASAPLGAGIRTLASGETVAVLNTAGNSVRSLNLKRHLDDATVEYIVFGIGNNSTAVGPTGLFNEAPTHFGGEDAMNPIDVYQRYCVVFSVNGEGDVHFELACSVHPDGFDGAEAHVIGYYEETRK